MMHIALEGLGCTGTWGDMVEEWELPVMAGENGRELCRDVPHNRCHGPASPDSDLANEFRGAGVLGTGGMSRSGKDPSRWVSRLARFEVGCAGVSAGERIVWSTSTFAAGATCT